MFMPDNSVFVKVENPNMAPDRTRNQRLSMEDRLTTFHEVEKTYTEEEALREASRCLGCPRKWCSVAPSSYGIVARVVGAVTRSTSPSCTMLPIP